MAPNSKSSNSVDVTKTRIKFTPKPPLPAEERLKKLNLSLVDQIADGFLENGIKTCNKMLLLSPTSIPTFQTLLFLLLQTDNFPAALHLVDSFSSKIESDSSSSSPGTKPFEFEKAYCLYRLHREDEALVILEAMKKRRSPGSEESEEETKCRHLEAQILYRKSSLPASLSLYTSLFPSSSSTSGPAEPDLSDLRQNIATIQACIAFDPSSRLSGIEKRGLEGAAPGIPASSGVGGRGVNAAASGSGTGAGKAKAGVPEGKGGIKAGSGAQRTAAAGPRKPRHPLPKGATFNDKHVVDSDRWLPLRLRTTQRSTTVSTSTSNKKRPNKAGGGGKKEGMGAGMTQGSVGDGGSGKGGGGKKGKKR